MLKILRKKKLAKKVWIILAIIIVPAFTLWGIGGALRSQREGSAGRIAGRNISLLEFQDSLAAVRAQAIMQFGENYSEIKRYLNLESQAWDRLILLGEAKKRKITANDGEVVELIESYPFFQRKGRFDKKIYDEMLQYAFRIQPRIFEEQTRQNIILSKLYKQVTDDVGIPDEELKAEYERANEEISTSYIVSSHAEFAKTLNPSQQELKDYFNKNPIKFKQPLSFNLEYVALDSQDKIKQALSKLKRRGLNKPPKEDGLAVKETGYFSQVDPIPGIGWSPEISGLISNLKAGEVSPPIHSDKFYYLLKLKEKKEAFIPDFENIKDKVREGFLKEKSAELAKVKIEEALKGLKSSNDFKRIAKETHLKSDSTGTFKFGSYIEGIGVSDNFWTAARDLKEGSFSDIIEMPSGFYIIKIKSRSPIDAKEFESEKQDFRQKLLLQKKQESFSKFSEGLKRKAR